MATEEAVKAISVPASADLSASQYHFVDVDSNGQLVVAASPSTVLGVLQDKPAAAGRAGSVAINGRTKIVFGGTVAAGSAVTCNASGEAVAVTTGQPSLGMCIEGAGDGEIGSVVLTGFTVTL